MTNKRNLTYKEAESLIFNAYFKDEIIPMDQNFCFCGTLSPDRWWGDDMRDDRYPYSVNEYRRMESALFSSFTGYITYLEEGVIAAIEPLGRIHNYEERLFNGMCAALEVLKQIHVERGENVDDNISLSKRHVVSPLINNLPNYFFIL